MKLPTRFIALGVGFFAAVSVTSLVRVRTLSHFDGRFRGSSGTVDVGRKDFGDEVRMGVQAVEFQKGQRAYRTFSKSDISEALKQVAPSEYWHLIREYIDNIWNGSLDLILDRVLFLVDLEGVKGGVSEGGLRELIARMAIEKGVPVEDILPFTKDSEQGRRSLRVLCSLRSNELVAASVKGLIGGAELGEIFADATQSPSTVRKLLDGINGAVKKDAIQKYTEVTLKTSPQSATAIANEFGPLEYADDLRVSIASNLLQFDRSTFNQWTGAMSTSDQVTLLNEAFKRGSVTSFREHQREAAAEAYLELSPKLGVLSMELTIMAFRALKGRSIVDLEKRIRSLPASFHDAVLNAVYKEHMSALLSNDLEAAEAFLPVVPTAIIKDLQEQYVMALGARDIKSAEEYINNLDDPKPLLMKLIVSPEADLSFDDRLEKVKLLLSQGLTEADATNLISKLLSPNQRLYGTYDPLTHVEKIKNFVSTLPNDYLKTRAAAELIELWSQHDPIGASEWTAELPAGSARDAAVKMLVEFSKDDPEYALANAAAVSDPAMRTSAIDSIVKSWRRIDPNLLQSLIQESPLSEHDKGNAAKMLGGD